jgi:tRNA pseudouridine38-40 synthase
MIFYRRTLFQSDREVPDFYFCAMRYFLEIAYKGTNYHGWQIQDNALSVQEVLNKALEKLLGQKLDTLGSGRTDTGVHALQQFLQLESPRPLSYLKDGHALNGLLPGDISVNGIYEVAEDFHVRHDAIERSYLYRIISKKDPFKKDLAAYYPFELNHELMNQAAQILLEYQDFQCFSKSNSGNDHFLCDIRSARWEKIDREIQFKISANRFLRGMVRAIVGTMLLIGQGKMDIEEFKKIIESKNRKKAGPSALPEGLFLSRVQYPVGKLKQLI